MRHLIILCAVFGSVYGQDSAKTFQLGLDISLGYNNTGRGNFLPAVTVSGNRHGVFAGPLLINNADPVQRGPLFGIQAGYQFYPNGRQKTFNLFFEYDFNFLDGKIVDTAPAMITNPYGGVKTRTIGFFSLFNYFSYGFRLNILKGLYLKTNVGLGLGWSGEEFKYEYWSGNVSGDFRMPPYFTTGWLIKGGLGYDFLAVKKK